MQKDSSNQQETQAQELSQEDQQLLAQASEILEFLQHPAWEKWVKPFLIQLSAEGYPKPQDFKTYEEMLPVYTFALGGTSSIKKFIDFLKSQESVASNINKKIEKKEAYAI